MTRQWMGHRAVSGIPRTAATTAIALLVVGYVPETGLDHLHLHVEDGHEYVHDHLHAGLHEHHHTHHHHPGVPVDTHDDHGGHPNGRSGVVTYTQAAQVRPPAVEVAEAAAPIEQPPRPAMNHGGRPADLHRPWSPRAPPA